MDERLKELMQELGNAINESLSDSNKIEGTIAEIRRAGFDVFLILEATIGFNKIGEKGDIGDDHVQVHDPPMSNEIFFSRQDEIFLKALKIKPGEE